MFDSKTGRELQAQAMSLLDELKAAGRALDIQFQPSANEIQSVAGALVHYLEHGDAFLKAAEGGVNDVAELLTPKPDQPAEPTPAPEPVVGPADQATAEAPAAVEKSSAELTDDELDAQIRDLQAQQDARRATSQQTTVEHEAGSGSAEPVTHRGFFNRGNG